MWHMGGVASVKLRDVSHTRLKLTHQADLDAALLPDLIYQLGSAHEWSVIYSRTGLR